MMDVVTGGLSYIGKHITQRLVSSGKKVLVLTGHPNRSNPFGDRVEIAPFEFDNELKLIRNLRGADILYNTYWVRFNYGAVSFDQAVENTRRLIQAAEEAGVRKIVHLSVSNPSEDSPFPYFRGKAILEKAIAQSKLPFAIIRPTLVFGGGEEILINNIAWLLRRFPIFVIPGRGDYRLQPIHVEDLVEIAVDAAENVHNRIMDAAGPDALKFEEMILLIARKIGSRSSIFYLGPRLSLFLLKIVGLLVHDVVLTRDELGALMGNLLVSNNPPIGKIRLGDWLDRGADRLGRRYASELDRHYR
jgi:nucleoside-diphosphate-sugar epimerase